ncbi:MAG TPA: VTT domain-containing protein [Pirellula sp.]|nr:VTT domain-containing protein [Pirellula sp.]
MSTAIVIIIAALVLIAQRYSSMELLVRYECNIREYVRIKPVQSWVLGFVIYTCLSLIPGTAGKSFVCGWIFGFWPATILVDSALTLAALVAFFASRFLLRDAIESRFGVYLELFRRNSESSLGFYLLMLRLIHTPFSFVNYVAGATNVVPTKTFWWTTQVGLLPATMIFVYAGTQIPSLATIADRGVFALLDARLLVALIAPAILTPVVRRIIHK